jgi:hypothetical protein
MKGDGTADLLHDLRTGEKPTLEHASPGLRILHLLYLPATAPPTVTSPQAIDRRPAARPTHRWEGAAARSTQPWPALITHTHTPRVHTQATPTHRRPTCCMPCAQVGEGCTLQLAQPCRSSLSPPTSSHLSPFPLP